ncbi:FAD-dependent monooxygenase [Kitasatospora kifunensis]|uniref:FAD-dependent monooxygenase n=1 Tax=Kitasatospora kifunensis TaxID=58351 RepID=UPI0028AFB8B2|nr:FAD-dependent monooxygenase [Kitasatospora kifunensis]
MGIVGAGPVGLALALRLASLGVASVILEQDPQLRKQGSKACLIQGDVLEVLDKFGCADPVAEEGVTWTVGHTYVRGEVIRSQVYERPIGYGPFVNISQYRIEQLLSEQAERHPLISLRWGHTVEAVEQGEAGVFVGVRTATGRSRVQVRYLAACDGVRSALRELVGVAWTGYTHKDRFLITDIRAELPLARERHFHYDAPFNPGRQLVMHPQPDNVWRIDWQLPPDADIAVEQRDGRLDQRIRAVIGDVPYEIDWWSTYRFHQRVVDRFRVGRVFFAGDAAHALPPYGSRGMNSGIQDADNLAWKFAAVLAGDSEERLLDSYHDERHAAAQENLRVTEATIRFMIPPSRLRRWSRRVLLALAPRVESVRGKVNSGRMAEPYVYRESPLVTDAASHPLAGAFAPDGYLLRPSGEQSPGQRDGQGQQHGSQARCRLRRLFGQEFVVLHFPVAQDPALFAKATAHLPARVWPVLAVETDGTGHGTVVDQDGAVHAAYGATGPCWFLIRPDGHIAATGPADDPARAAERLATALATASATAAARPTG